MANEVKILVACGSGVATSTVAQEAVKKILADANIPGKILKGSMSEIPLKQNDELEGVEGIDVIVHLAGKAHDTKNEAVAQTYFDINTGLTRKVFDYFLKSSAKKFIFFSSVKAVADFVEVESGKLKGENRKYLSFSIFTF